MTTGKTRKMTKGPAADRPLTPRGSWLRGLDLNQRPLGYENGAGLLDVRWCS
jgi:hypothetical protein